MPRPPRRTRRRLSLQVLDDRRVLAAIVGSVFHDANDSFRKDETESGLSGRLVYIDQNNNARMDSGEQYALSDAAGNFAFEDMADGEYALRLFNATRTQAQTTPMSAAVLHDAVLQSDISAVIAATPLGSGGPEQRIAPAILASGANLQIVGSDGNLGTPFIFTGDIDHLSRLADGSILVANETNDGTAISIVSESLSEADALFTPGGGVSFGSLGVDDVGRGIAIGPADSETGESELYAIDRGALEVSATGVMVAAGSVITGDSTPRTNDGPTRSVISHASLVDDGNGGTTQTLAVSFWSNSDESLLSAPIVVSGASEVVAFHDEAGLLVLRSGDALSVHDVDSANLATLFTIDDTESIAGIDASRGLIVTLSPRSFGGEGSTEDAGLRLLDSETGSVVADLAIDLSAIGDIAAVSLDANLNSLAIAGAAGMTQVSLRRAGPARVQVAGTHSTPASFGVRLIGDNSAPAFSVPPVLSVAEDNDLITPAPGLLSTAVDAEGDTGFVVLPTGAPNSGLATLNPSGSLTYSPFDNFEGTDTFTVILHDGRDSTEATITINVTPVPDAPSDIEAVIDPVPENILPADVDGEFDAIGIINIIDPDQLNQFEIEVLNDNRVPDNRFDIINDQLIFVGPGRLDFETEWEIPLIISVSDPDADTTIEYATTLSITDADDPVTDILPGSASVRENRPGEIIKTITVIDEDFEDIHTLKVDDDRFEVVFGELKLKDDRALDHEAEMTVSINITASFKEDSFTKAIVITVLDAPETPQNFSLTNHSVLELEPGDIVGEMTIAGNPAANGHRLTVDDPRFIFEDSILRLADDEFIERTPGIDDEILLKVTATPESGGVEAVEVEFNIAVLENDKPFHNDDLPEDVNGNGNVTASDALAIINYLNSFGPGPVGEGDPAYGYDVNNDGMVTSLDALLVINELNTTGTSSGTVGNEPGGEPVSPRGDSGAERGIAAESKATEIAPVPKIETKIAPLGRQINLDALALGDTLSEPLQKTVDATQSEALQKAVESLAADTSKSDSDEETTDQVFGEPDIDLLG
ncbi:dockerin type I domain-containing protein [Rhodopirellula sallentina]|uniref:dockerin type I domain-containing protein n=1 Tax=Rhodopirellula sallentina TaxID=1263869 RepID=UPI001181A91E|nr:dockerin type I domain-containing protein [Rhodopirellula sallentina]